MTANPIELIGGLASTSNVVKADLIAWAKARVEQVLADVTEIRNTTLAGQLVVQLKSNGVRYIQDTTDTTTADDGVSCIVSLDGKRFKPVSSVPAPTTVSLGGVFASNAVSHQYVTGLDTSGNLTRAQPAAADLSNGTTGSGGVVLATAPVITSPTIATPTVTIAADNATALTVATGANGRLTIGTDASGNVLMRSQNSVDLRWGVNSATWLTLTNAGLFSILGTFGITGSSSGSTQIKSAATASGIVTLPSVTDTLLARADVATVTNKSIDASANTITNLATSMFAANVVDTDGTLAANSNTRLASQAAVKTYVDTVAQGLDAKPSVLVATTANITLSGEQTIDGTLTSASRILVKSQTTQSQNGIYVTAAGSWTRATDADAWTELPGAFVFVEKGTVNGDCGFVCTVDAGGTIGTTAVTFTQFSGAGTYTASTGLTLTGTAFSIDASVATLIGAQSLTNKTYNGNTWTAGTGVLTLGAAKTLTVSNTLALTGTDGSSIAFGAGGTVLYSGGSAGGDLTGTFPNPTIAANAVTNAKLANMAAGTIKANATGGSTTPTDVTAATARSSSVLNVDSFTGHGDSAYAILASDRTVGTNAAFTASRTWTLPAANAVNPGQEIIVADFQGTVTGSNTLVISRVGSDTINGGTSVTISSANGAYMLKSDGTSKWTAQALGAAAAGGVSSVTAGTGLSGGIITTSGTIAVSLIPASAALGADVLLNNTSNFFDGPSISQGTSGTFLVTANVIAKDTAGAATFIAKLWDGTNIVATGAFDSAGANKYVTIGLSGIITSPAANLKISIRDASSTSGKITFNDAGLSKDSTISAVRIA